MESKGSKRRSVVLVPAPFQGHITPMLQLGSILKSKGFSIIVAHSEYNSPNSLNHPEFTFLSLPDNTADLDKSFYNAIAVLNAINTNCKVHLHDNLVRIMDNEEVQGGIDCIIYDNIMYFAENVAQDLKIPSIVMRPNNAAYLITLREILSLRAENSWPLPESRNQEMLPTLEPFRFKDLPFPITTEIPETLVEFWEAIFSIGSSQAIIWNTMSGLEDSILSRLQQRYQVPFFCIGPFNKLAQASKTSLLEEDNSCIDWLDKQAPNSVLYVSLGSLASMDEKELIETAWGLAKSDQLFLWVVRQDSINDSNWIKQLPDDVTKTINERGCIVKWAPQKAVLAHPAVAGFWSHCGWNSTLESVSEGTPMICRPHFSDQMVNARYLTDIWKIGLEIEGTLERGIIEKTIRRLMVEIEGKEIRKRAIDMKCKLEAFVEQGGSSYKSLNELTEFISTETLPTVMTDLSLTH